MLSKLLETGEGTDNVDVIRVEQKLKEGREEGRLRRIEGCRWRPPTSGFAESRP